MKSITITAAALLTIAGATAQDIKLAVQAYTFRDRTFVETVETAKRLGIENIEMYGGQKLGGGMEGTTDFKKITPETVKTLKKLINDAGVNVVSYGVTNAKDEKEWAQLNMAPVRAGRGLRRACPADSGVVSTKRGHFDTGAESRMRVLGARFRRVRETRRAVPSDRGSRSRHPIS